MFFFEDKPPWYVAGLAFECTGCGGCCAGPEEGYIWVTDEEIAVIAAELRISEAEIRKKYVRKVGRRITLVERKDNNDCIFLVPNGSGGRKCRIYSVRPMQCRTWPFWSGNIRSPEAWAAAGMRCPGINRGQMHSCEDIQTKCNKTRE